MQARRGAARRRDDTDLVDGREREEPRAENRIDVVEAFVHRIVEGGEGIVAAYRGQRVARRAPASAGEQVNQSLRSDAHVFRGAQVVDTDIIALAFGPLVNQTERAVDVADDARRIAAVTRSRERYRNISLSVINSLREGRAGSG